MDHSRGRGARKARVVLVASTAALGAGQLAPAAAQETGSAQPPSPAYEEIVVTARNRTERENAVLEERYTFANDRQRYTYEATYSDPTVLTRPFTVTIPSKRVTVDSPQDGWHNETFVAKRSDGVRSIESYERTCIENNDGHGELALGSS